MRADQTTVVDTIALLLLAKGIGGGCCLFGTSIDIDGAESTIFATLPYFFPNFALCRPSQITFVLGERCGW
jgi:hypothetical protein